MEADGLLVRRFKNRDLEAFDEIFGKYHKAIYYYIYKMSYSAEAAEDITQDTFVKVYKSLAKVEDEVKLSAWIYKIAHNTFIDYKRKYKVNYELLENIDYQEGTADGDSSSNPEQYVLNTELSSQINKTMRKLNNRYKSVIILRDYNHLSYKEIALILNLSETAVKSLIHRARLEFQKIFKEL